jgi:D-serine deaminase-like pyridoxal phosphate-dependent protein
MDRTPVRMGLTTVQNVSLGVLTTVVSANSHYFIIDAGSKVLSSDAYAFSINLVICCAGPHMLLCSFVLVASPRSGSPDKFGAQCFGLAVLEKDLERIEHEPTSNRHTTRDGHEVLCWEVKKLSEEHGWIQQVEGIPAPAIGSRMVVLPNHSCVVANLTNQLYIQGAAPTTWKTVSRGCTQ